MSLKKRMFRSNITILFTALLSLMLIIVAVLVFFEDSLENQLDVFSETQVESHADEVVRIIEEGKADTAQTLKESYGGRMGAGG